MSKDLFKKPLKILVLSLLILFFIFLNAIREGISLEERSVAAKIFAVAYGYVKEDILAYSASHCDLIILSALTYPTPPILVRKYNKSIKILGYCETMSTDTRYDDFNELNKHEDWFLHDKSGRRIKVYIYKTDTRYGMDKTNEKYQDWLAKKCKIIVDGGYDGVFLDNLGTVLGYRNLLKYSGFPVGMNNQKWQEGSKRLLAKIKSAVGNNKIVVFNQIGVDDNKSTTSLGDDGVSAAEASISFTDACDGAMKEDFFNNGNDIDENFFKLIDLLKTINKKNKYTLCLSRRSLIDNAKTLYCLYLLALDGENAYFSYQSDYKKITWFDFYKIDLGIPLDDYFIENSIGMRKFKKGIVVVNCSIENKMVKLPGEYRDKDGRRVKEILLNSKKAEILFN